MFSLPKLDYAYTALEPWFDAKTMELHHTKHHQTYITKLNEALEKAPEWKGKTLEELLGHLNEVPETIRKAVRNHGGGHYNHCLFWKVIGPPSGAKPEGKLADAFKEQFGGFDGFKEKFAATANAHFASGWAWLCTDAAGKLSMFTSQDHDCPLTQKLYPLYVLDLWEHAFYLNYQNKRPDFVGASWNVVNWKTVSERFEKRPPVLLPQ